jgi:hypothetical protein
MQFCAAPHSWTMKAVQDYAKDRRGVSSSEKHIKVWLKSPSNFHSAG